MVGAKVRKVIFGVVWCGCYCQPLQEEVMGGVERGNPLEGNHHIRTEDVLTGEREGWRKRERERGREMGDGTSAVTNF